MLKKILLGLSVLSNLATLAGLWIAIISAPTSVQPRIAQVLLIAGAVCSIGLYLSFFWFVLQPRTSESSAKHEKNWGAFRRVANPSSNSRGPSPKAATKRKAGGYGRTDHDFGPTWSLLL